jgi:hypothetical protein
MRLLAFLVAFILSFYASAEESKRVHIDFGTSLGWLIAGSSKVKGADENPTGGIAIILVGTVSVGLLPWLDVYYTQSPMVVAPQSVESLGVVDANDIGASFHTVDRTLGLSLGGTAAPIWMNFCNGARPEPWCKKEALIIWGGETHVDVRLAKQENGRALVLHVRGRLLYAQPEAWTYEGLRKNEKKIFPTMWMFELGERWSW